MSPAVDAEIKYFVLCFLLSHIGKYRLYKLYGAFFKPPSTFGSAGSERSERPFGLLSASLGVHVLSTRGLFHARRYVNYTHKCADRIQFLVLPRLVPTEHMMLMMEKDLFDLQLESRFNVRIGSRLSIMIYRVLP